MEKKNTYCRTGRIAAVIAVLLEVGCVYPPAAAAAEDFSAEQFKKMKSKWTAEAEQRYPICRIGETVTVVYRKKKGGTEKATGKFYGQNDKFIVIGDEQIPKADIAKDQLVRFDPVRTGQLRKEYVIRRVTQFQQAKEAEERKMRQKAEEILSEDEESLPTDLLSGDKLVTKKKKVYRDWTIEAVEDLYVVVKHAEGGGKIRISELPDDIALKCIGPGIEEMIAASRKKNPNERKEILKEILKLYPAAKPLVEEERTRIRKEPILKLELTQAIDAEDEKTRIRNLLALRETYRQTPWAAERIDREIEGRKVILQLEGAWLPPFDEERPRWQTIYKTHHKVMETLEKARKLSSEAQFDQAIAMVEDIIKREPQFAEAYQARDQLISLKKAKVESALEKARKLAGEYQFGQAIAMVEDIIKQEPQFAEEAKAQELLDTLTRDKEKAEKELAVVRELKIDDQNQMAQLVIRKEINKNNKYTLLIYPMYRKNDAMKLYQAIDDIGSSFQSYKRHENEARQLERRGKDLSSGGWVSDPIGKYRAETNLLDQRMDHLKKAEEALKMTVVHDAFARGMLLYANNVEKNTEKDGVLKRLRLVECEAGKTCTLSDIKGPVILLVYEKINMVDDFDSFQGWYKEYTPAGQTEEWILK